MGDLRKVSKLGERIAADIAADLSDRSGFDLCDVDDEIRYEMLQAWAEIVDRNILE